jgi:hypothetical protein
MQLVSWSDWLDRHIPYYEQQRQRDNFGDSPPVSILIIDPVDRNRLAAQKGFAGSTWEATSSQIANLGYVSQPVFLNNDTHQRWYWGFWNEQHALMAVLKLT